MLQAGIKSTQQITVTEKDSAAKVGSGLLDVFATPSMIALMESTSWKAVAPYLEEGQGTVGTLLNIEHVAATPIGMTVTCEAELVEVDGRKLVFNVTASDEVGVIGKGRHERFIVDNAKFQAKANNKGK